MNERIVTYISSVIKEKKKRKKMYLGQLSDA